MVADEGHDGQEIEVHTQLDYITGDEVWNSVIPNDPGASDLCFQIHSANLGALQRQSGCSTVGAE